MTGQAHNSRTEGGIEADTALVDAQVLAAQRQQARRAAVLLGIVAVCFYLGFILATSLRH